MSAMSETYFRLHTNDKWQCIDKFDFYYYIFDNVAYGVAKSVIIFYNKTYKIK